ncbi:MAG: transglycosylase SLT domain-containing protein [Burkholderiales bacterium]|nr:transglycosylase SLT domain-containing protein [Burkholderiales bacterium]
MANESSGISWSYAPYGSFQAPSFASLAALMLSMIALAVSLQGRPSVAVTEPVVEESVPLQPFVADPVAVVATAAPAVEPRAPAPEERKIRAMSDYLGKRYFVSTEAIQRLVEMAFAVGHEVNLDPLLILAVMAVESRFNPIAESNAGAQGLMQVIPKYHADKLPDSQSDASFLNPSVNVLVGAKVLKDYIGRSGGNLQTGLQMYNGSPWDTTAQYASKVIAEKERLRQLLTRRFRSSN